VSSNCELPTRSLLKVSEASARFNVALRTIYFWYRKGKIDGINVNGKCLRIFSASLREFLRSRIANNEDNLGPGWQERNK